MHLPSSSSWTRTHLHNIFVLHYFLTLLVLMSARASSREGWQRQRLERDGAVAARLPRYPVVRRVDVDQRGVGAAARVLFMRKTPLLLGCFPCVCPEPVAVK